MNLFDHSFANGAAPFTGQPFGDCTAQDCEQRSWSAGSKWGLAEEAAEELRFKLCPAGWTRWSGNSCMMVVGIAFGGYFACAQVGVVSAAASGHAAMQA